MSTLTGGSLNLTKPEITDQISLSIPDLANDMQIIDDGVTAHKTAAVLDHPDGSVTNAKIATGIDATKIADGTVTSIVFQNINSLTSNAQTQLNAKANLSGANLSGEYNHQDNLVTRAQLKDYSETVVTDATATGAETLDIANANVFDSTLTGNTTFTFSNPSASGQSCSFTLILRQGATAFTVTWPASVKWNGDQAPSLTNVSKTIILTFVTVNGGTRWYGFLAGNDFAT